MSRAEGYLSSESQPHVPLLSSPGKVLPSIDSGSCWLGGPNGEAGWVNAVPWSVGVADNSPRKQEGQEVHCLPPPCGKRGNQSPERLNESPETVQ